MCSVVGTRVGVDAVGIVSIARICIGVGSVSIARIRIGLSGVSIAGIHIGVLASP